jgi:hypothetical protein
MDTSTTVILDLSEDFFAQFQILDLIETTLGGDRPIKELFDSLKWPQNASKQVKSDFVYIFQASRRSFTQQYHATFRAKFRTPLCRYFNFSR